jgi:hypothetical protein
MHEFKVSIVEYTSQDQPGWVRFTLNDAFGRVWSFVEKLPVVTEANLTVESIYPQSGSIACQLLSVFVASDGRRIARVDTKSPWGVESEQGVSIFEVLADQVRETDRVA